jgi:hypothetical protein
MQHYIPQDSTTLHPVTGLSNDGGKTLGSCMVQNVPLYILQNYTGCLNKSARFNFLIKLTIYSKCDDIFISV